MQIENVSAQGGLGAGTYSVEFTTDTNLGLNCGIILCRDLILLRHGLLFRSNFGPTGVNNTTIHRIHSEGQFSNEALITFDPLTVKSDKLTFTGRKCRTEWAVVPGIPSKT